MIRALTIFNIFAGAASIIGVLIQLVKPDSQWPQEILIPVCSVAGLLSLYILLVPGSPFEKNVKNKIAYYRESVAPEMQGDIMIQRGTVRFWGFGEKAIEFHEPFQETPKFELIDAYGNFNNEGGLPDVRQVTPNQAVVRRGGGAVFGMPRCVWVARGRPLSKK